MFRVPLIATIALAVSACAVTTQTVPLDGAEALDFSRGGAVSAADPRAQAAGEEILRRGGSATDAAIAVMLALTVVEPQSSGIGGGGFLVRSDESGNVITWDGRETAPATATPFRFLDDEGERLPRDIRVTSGLSVGVPGNIALAAKAHGQYGKLEWAELFEPAIALARDGFLMNRRLHASLDSQPGRADKTEQARLVFFGEDGEPKPVGSRITNPQFELTLLGLAEYGPNFIYNGTLTDLLASYVASETSRDGKMTPEDIVSYQAKPRDAVCSEYRSHKICGMGPPSSGGVAVAQMLGQLERFDLASLGPKSPAFWHLFLESQRLAFADRELYLADSDFVDVPVKGLVAPDYIASRGALINQGSALVEALPGKPEGAPTALANGDEPPENGTTHFSVVDAKGNAVSYTSTIEGAFGSGLFIGGFYLNNELTDFSTTPSKDGKLVANRVEGGKRPRSSMAPTIVFAPDGEIMMVVGAAGGPTIPVQVARAIIGVIDFDLSAEEAIALPIIMAFGSTVVFETDSMIDAMQDALADIGHTNMRGFSAPLKANALLRTAAGWESASDPRIAELLATE